MCTMSSVYPIKNYKMKIIQPKWLRDLNESFYKKYKASKKATLIKGEIQNGSSL